MATIYSLNDDGTEVQLPKLPNLSEFDANEVYIVVDDVKRIIFIWKGSHAPVRKKFISARTASKIRQQYGLTFKVDSIDQAEEPSDFLELMNVSAGSESTPAPAPIPSGPIASARPAPSSTSSGPIASARPAPSSTSSGPIASARPAPRPTPSSIPSQQTPPSSSGISQPSVQSQHHVKQDLVFSKTPIPTQGVTQNEINDIIDKIKDLEVPEGLQREIVIIKNQVFSCSKEFHKLFQKEVLRLDPMSDLPDGAFPASDYYTRLFLEKGEVIFVELFSEIPRTERDEFLSEVRASLRDLTKLGI
ncbi:MAG: hypothetical protein ACFFD1_04300 [Candidatus Thorarchaeota archaeon]